MTKWLLSAATVTGTVAAAVLARGFIDGARHGDPEGYLLLGAVLFAVAATIALIKLL